MKKIIIISFLALIFTVPANAVMCFKSGENVSGLNKICYYKCPNGTSAITIKAHQLCPLNIDG